MSETDNNISISIDGKPITSLINRNERRCFSSCYWLWW